MGLDLLSIFVLTPILLLQRKTRITSPRTLSRWSCPHPTWLVVWFRFAMFLLLDPEFGLMVIWTVAWCYFVIVLLLILVWLKRPLPQELYDD